MGAYWIIIWYMIKQTNSCHGYFKITVRLGWQRVIYCRSCNALYKIWNAGVGVPRWCAQFQSLVIQASLELQNSCGANRVYTYTGDSRTGLRLILGWAQIGSLQGFPEIKLTVVCYCVYHLHLLRSWCEDKRCTVCKDRGHICTTFVFACGRQKSKDPQFQPHG